MSNPVSEALPSPRHVEDEMLFGMPPDRMSDKGYFFPLDLIPVKMGFTRPLFKTAQVLLL